MENSMCKNRITQQIESISNSSGITLIALIITIIILIILAGVAINLILGENGLFNTAKKAGEEYEKTAIKEEIEYAIVDIKIEKIQNNEELTMDILEQELPNKLKDIIIERDDEGQIVGEYKGYDYTITKDYEVIVDKVGIKPIVTYTLSDETIGINELTITLNATISEGSITKIIKPDGNYEENVNQVQYKVTQNGKYKFIVEASNGSKRTKIVQISILKPIAPIIKSDEAYPVLTQYGVEGVKVKIIYEENENLEHFYSEDDGATWKMYNGEFKPVSSKIIAKSVVKTNPNCYTQTQVDNVVPKDAMAPEAYDNNMETLGFSDDLKPPLGTDGTAVLYVDETIYEKKVRIRMNDQVGQPYLYIYNKLGEELYKLNLTNTDTTITIPTGAHRIVFQRVYSYLSIYEIGPEITPQITEIKHYPTLTQYGVRSGYSEITIDYFASSVQKLYKINEGEWKTYQNTSIDLELGETLYAKGIDQYGNETNISNYVSELPKDAMAPEAYDNSMETLGFSDDLKPPLGTDGTAVLYVDETIYEKKVRIRMNDQVGQPYLYIYNKLGEELYKLNLTNTDTTITIPTGAHRIVFQRVYSYLSIYEIEPEN